MHLLSTIIFIPRIMTPIIDSKKVKKKISSKIKSYLLGDPLNQNTSQ